jgi:hypothetical protein
MTSDTVTVQTSSGMTVMVTSDGAITIDPPAVPPVTPPNPGASTTVFFDDFTGPAGSLPDAAHWNVISTTAGPQNAQAFGHGDQEQYLANPPLIHQDGNSNLIFTVGTEGSLGADPGFWPAPRVDSLATPGQFHNGTFLAHGETPKIAVLPGQSCEFSAKTMPLAGLWPSLWFMCRGVSGGNYPGDYYEFDLMEAGLNGAPAITRCTAWGPGAGAQQNLSARTGGSGPAFNLGDGQYHKYRLDYHPDHLDAYIDGNLQYSITQALVNAAFGPQAGLNPQFNGQEWPYNQPSEGLCIIMNCAVNQAVVGTLPAAASLPHEVMAVDSVRIYAPAGPYVA